jgi:hypothetical protein
MTRTRRRLPRAVQAWPSPPALLDTGMLGLTAAIGESCRAAHLVAAIGGYHRARDGDSAQSRRAPGVPEQPE